MARTKSTQQSVNVAIKSICDYELCQEGPNFVALRG